MLHSLTELFFNILKVTASSQGLGTYVDDDDDDDDDDDANDDTWSGDLPVYTHTHIYINK